MLVDALMQPGHVELIGAALERAGAGFANLEQIILTHHHQDHTGGLAEVARRVAPGTQIRCGADDVDAIRASTGVEVQALNEDELVLGMEVIATPGHTPGHVCLFDAESSTMLLGDVAGNYDGWQYPPAPFTHDADQAATALRTLARREFNTALPAHRAPVRVGAAASLREFLDRS